MATAKKKEIPYTQFTRVPVEVKPEGTENILAGRAFLVDLRPDSFSVFCEEALEKGDKLALVLEHPKKLFARGEVVWCTLTPWNPRILTEKRFKYRIYIRLLFDTPEEQIEVRQFCQSV